MSETKVNDEPVKLDHGCGEKQHESCEKFVEEGKNKFVVKCQFCGSKILDVKSANFVQKTEKLPLMQQDTRKPGEIQSESIEDYFCVENMYTFENIGFSYSVGSYKYLSCADCDAGPVGYFDTKTSHSYVALSRVVQS